MPFPMLDPFNLLAPYVDRRSLSEVEDDLKKKAIREAERQKPAPPRFVTMSDSLVRAGHGLSLAEKRIICLAVSKLNPKRYVGAMEDVTTPLAATEFAEAFNVDPTTAYEQLKEAETRLFKREVTYFAPRWRDGKQVMEKEKIHWLDHVHYSPHEGFVSLTWNRRVLSELTDLRKKFTRYQLSRAAALRSAYSWRLLELLVRFEKRDEKAWAQYEIEDFWNALDVPPKATKNFGKVRTRIIEPAIKEIGLKDGLVIKPFYKKTGRRVSAVRFEFWRDPQHALDFSEAAA